MKYKKSIRRKFFGHPPMFASIDVEGVKPYILEYGGDKLCSCPTNKSIRNSIYASKAEFSYNKRHHEEALKNLQKSHESVVVTDSLVLFSPKEEAFYLFSHFTEKFAVFKFLKSL